MKLIRNRSDREAEITRKTIDVAQVKAEVSILIGQIVNNLDRIQAEVDSLDENPIVEPDEGL